MMMMMTEAADSGGTGRHGEGSTNERDRRWRDDVTVTRMLEAGAERGRPVDALVARLHDGESFAGWIVGGPGRQLGDPKAMLLDGEAPIDDLRRWKDGAKASAKERPDDPAGLATYFAVLAAGLAHHGVSLSAVGRQRLDEVFLDLAEAASGAGDVPWAALFERAVRASECGSTDAPGGD